MKIDNATKTPVRKKVPAAKPVQTETNGSKPVTIEARIDVGFGNILYLRGEGQGLTWTRGIPLLCVGTSTWKWTGRVAEKLKFKLLLNDSIWSKGDDLVVGPGETLEVAPSF